MKYKKYILLIFLTMLINIGTINALNKTEILSAKDNINIKILAITSDNNLNGGDCNKEAIFGSKSDPNSISYLVNEILQYPKYIVPALVIVFTTIDLFKAVMAGKEDEIKSAQKLAIKRVVYAVLVFLVPWIVNVAFSLLTSDVNQTGYEESRSALQCYGLEKR